MTFPTDKQRAELHPGEDVLWCGKSRPTPFLRGCWQRVIAGALGAAVLLWAYPTVAGNLRNSDGLDVFVLLPALAFAAFALLEIWCLLTPIYYWIRSKYTTWIVTNQRVIGFFGPRVRSWPRYEWRNPVLVEERANGCMDFLFTSRGLLIQGNHHQEIMVKAGIENVPPEDAPQLDAIFRKLQEKNDRKKLVSHKARLASMLDEFYSPQPPGDHEIGEYR